MHRKSETSSSLAQRGRSRRFSLGAGPLSSGGLSRLIRRSEVLCLGHATARWLARVP